MTEIKGTKALELWCKRLIKDCPNVQIDNMTTSWRNGMAFCALVHNFRPDLIDISSLKPENIYENNQLAFSIAEKHLGIPALLDPEDMVENEVPDRLSVLTYLSQFYQRLGHTVASKATEVTDSKSMTSSTSSPTSLAAPIKFGKTALDKCAACELPVYLAQRLIISQKLYHRRCFRCSKCLGHLNPKNYHIVNGSEYYCDSCKNDNNLPMLLNNNNDQMGMLAFSDLKCDKDTETRSEESIKPNLRPRPQSILERINMFENNVSVENIDNKVASLSIKPSAENNYNSKTNKITENVILSSPNKEEFLLENNFKMVEPALTDIPEKTYKSNVNKLIFLQTQLTSDVVDNSIGLNNDKVAEFLHSDTRSNQNLIESESDISKNGEAACTDVLNEEVCNITDDVRLASSQKTKSTEESQKTKSAEESQKTKSAEESQKTKSAEESQKTKSAEESQKPKSAEEAASFDVKDDKKDEPEISVPPRRKKVQASTKNQVVSTKTTGKKTKDNIDYPEDLNPFSDDEEDEEENKTNKESTNPFGSSEEEDDDVPPIQPSKPSASNQATPVRRHITACNPFWSDDEEPSSDEEEHHDSRTNMFKSSITTSTPNLPGTQRRKKTRAPPPPPVLIVQASDQPATSMDDVASISSYSSYNSTANSDYKSFSKLTPKSKQKRLAPTPPDSLSTMSGHGGSLERGMDSSGQRSITDSAKKKGPAPGLPLPERREVKLQMTPEELQIQLDLLETQQLGLERQGVLIEQMIRDKCEGDEPLMVPQEEVEDLVIQLCELVNEKNDLFRKQTELMFIRRQQRLEQEQADIEHEIRVIHSRPAVNRIDADKAREEQLVNRLVEIVRMRDELVQQIDAERRRERKEDLAIAASIANKRAQRNSESNSSTMKSMETLATPKKNKVKDKVKKQLKKAKNSLVPKKKNEEKPDKDKK